MFVRWSRRKLSRTPPRLTARPLLNRNSRAGQRKLHLFAPTSPKFSFPSPLQNRPCGGFLRTPVRDQVMIRAERKLAKIRREIVQRDKRQRRALQCIELAIERVTTGMSIAELAKRHNLTESKVRRDIETAIFLARSRMFEKTPSRLTSLNQSRQLGR